MTSKEKVKEVISTFYCSKDYDIESFLKNENKAILYERKSKSRTYLIFDEDGLEGGYLPESSACRCLHSIFLQICFRLFCKRIARDIWEPSFFSAWPGS